MIDLGAFDTPRWVQRFYHCDGALGLSDDLDDDAMARNEAFFREAVWSSR